MVDGVCRRFGGALGVKPARRGSSLASVVVLLALGIANFYEQRLRWFKVGVGMTRCSSPGDAGSVAAGGVDRAWPRTTGSAAPRPRTRHAEHRIQCAA